MVYRFALSVRRGRRRRFDDGIDHLISAAA